jgi:hypothetical protein
MGWRVVETDNFCGDYPDESFVGPVFKTKVAAERVALLLNGEVVFNDSYARHWIVVEEGYKLQPGFEP